MKRGRIAVWTLEEKIAAASKLPDTRMQMRSEIAIAKAALLTEAARHEAALQIIAERFDIEVWRAVKKSWSESEITA